MRERTPADDIVQGAGNRALLNLILDPMRVVAKKQGYAIAVHGSLDRDIDLIAIPWTEHAGSENELIDAICGAVAGITGSCLKHGDEWTEKPHGRKARTLLIYCGENHKNVDLSITPRLIPKE